MTITVHYTTQLKAAVGAASEQLDVDAPVRLADVLSILAERHGSAFTGMVFGPDGGLLPSILICIGDEQVDASYGDPLQDGAVVTLLSAISGG